MTVKLTSLAVRHAKPRLDRYGAPRRTEYPDGGSGLYLTVQPRGAKSFTLRYRINGRSRNLRLGSAAASEAEVGGGALTLAAARLRAAEARLQIERGIDPGLVKPLEAAAGSDRIEALVAQFLDLHVARKTRAGSAAATERIFRNLVLPGWRMRSIHAIKRRDVIELIERVAIDRPVLANRTLAALSKFCSWLISRDVLSASFTTGAPRPHREIPRDRALDDMEVRALWLACADLDPFDRALRLLLLTGQRRNEVSHMCWSEIDTERRLWVIPATRTKNGRVHAVSLSAQAWSLIESAPRFVGCDYVLSIDGQRPISGWAKAKDRIGRKAGLDNETWRLHDLRRTMAVGLQKLGTHVATIERTLNHTSGTFRGVTGVYQVYDYQAEIAVALQRWADFIEQLVSGEKRDTVVPMRGRLR